MGLPIRGAGGPVSAHGARSGLLLAAGAHSVERGRSGLPSPRVIVRSSWGGGGVKRNEGVEDTDADMEELLARCQKRLTVEVRPLPEWRSTRESARRKGREMLCRELCLHLGITPRQLWAIWRGGGLPDSVRSFLQEWGGMHRPLSLGAAVDMLEEHMASLYGTNSAPKATSAPGGPLALLLRAFRIHPQKDTT